MRDAEQYFPRYLSLLNKLKTLFDIQVIVVENDSVDNTKQLLSQTDFIVLSQDLGLPLLGQGTDSFRIETMAKLRNQYVNKLHELPPRDFVIVLDADIHDFELDGVRDSLNKINQWDVCTSNGIDNFGNTIMYYDIFTLVEDNIIMNSHTRVPYNIYEDLHKVDSAFGGMALYKYITFKDAAYKLVQLYGKPCSWHPDLRNTCEHVGLHLDMKQYTIVINPKQVVYR
jgi:hypothetical protein